MRCIPISWLIFSVFIAGCSGVKTRPCDHKDTIDCQTLFEQFTRTLEIDLGITGLTIFDIELGAKNTIEIDSITADYLIHIHQLCIDYNNCILTSAEYKREMLLLRNEQLRIRRGGDPEYNPALSEEVKALFLELNRKQQIKAIQRLLNHLGYKLDIDGTYGKHTKAAVEQFMQSSEFDGNGAENCPDDSLFMSLWAALSKRRERSE